MRVRLNTLINLSPRTTDESWRPGWIAKPGPLGQPVALENLDGESFVFEGYFLCDVQFMVGNVDVSPSLGVAQVVDFVLMLEFARREVAQSGSADVGLSPSTESWRFERSGSSLRVSKGQALGVTTVQEYSLAVSSSKKRAYDLLIDAHTELRDNEYLARELA
jgi:hypothetical protein